MPIFILSFLGVAGKFESGELYNETLRGRAAFLWAMRSGQFDDLDGAAWRAISDDDLPEDRRG